MKKRLSIIILFVMAFATTSFAMDKVIISDAWLRVAPNKVAGGFFEIKNNTDKPISIVSATATGAKTIELHSHDMVDGIMKMRKQDSIKVPANGSTSFNPHSFHLMMFKLDKDIFKVGNMVEINFTFDDASTISAKFQTLAFGQELKKDMDHSKMDHSKMEMPKK